MTSGMIQELCILVAKMGQKADDGSPLAVQLLNAQFLGEIAFQLARQNEMAHPVMSASENTSDRESARDRAAWRFGAEWMREELAKQCPNGPIAELIRKASIP